MSDTVWRLAWALPLVCAAGVCAMVFLRQVLAPAAPKLPARRLKAMETLSVSDDTCVHLLELDQQVFFVIESSQRAALVPAALSQVAGPVQGRPWARSLARMLERRK